MGVKTFLNIKMGYSNIAPIRNLSYIKMVISTHCPWIFDLIKGKNSRN